jgi:peptide/nickel transport system substrate-binding protein
MSPGSLSRTSRSTATRCNFDIDLAPQFVQQVLDDKGLLSRLITGPHTGVRWISINTGRIRSVECRKALVHAANKRKFRSGIGGAVFGEIATSVISPGLRAYRPIDLYDVKNHPEGDLQKAEELIAAAGDGCPKKLRFAFPGARLRLIVPLADSLERVGFQVDLIPIGATVNYYADAVGNPANDYDLMWAGWIADWASASAVISPVFHGGVIPKGKSGRGNNNLSLLDDPQINQLIDEAMAESVPERQDSLWAYVDQRIMELAPVIPLIYMNNLRMSGTNVRGGYIHPQYGEPDVTALGLANP